MNYDNPRQLEKTKKWHFTSMNDGRIWPIGYCAEGCEGHDTEDEAREHYRQYQLDKRLRFSEDREDASQQNRCAAEGCQEFTSGMGELGEWIFWPLCQTHRNRETVEILYPKGLDSVHS